MIRADFRVSTQVSGLLALIARQSRTDEVRGLIDAAGAAGARKHAAKGSEGTGAGGSSRTAFVCSDMWKPYLQVIGAQAGQALHVLDRFHITSHMNQAVDQVRRAESTRLRTKNKKAAQRLKHMRWPLLRRGSRSYWPAASPEDRVW